MSLPVIIIGETRLAGFNPAKIDEALGEGTGMSEVEPVKPSAGQYRQDVELRAQVRGEVRHLPAPGRERHRGRGGRPRAPHRAGRAALCPCNFYPDPQAEAKLRRWICACDEMQNWKYCHCLLFVAPDGQPITEYLPEDHEGRAAYGIVKDPHPDKGRATARVLERQKAEGASE